MRRYTMSFAAACAHTPEFPDRTAKRDRGDDVEFKVWSSREDMARDIRTQRRRALLMETFKVWRPCVRLGDGEGYGDA